MKYRNFHRAIRPKLFFALALGLNNIIFTPTVEAGSSTAVGLQQQQFGGRVIDRSTGEPIKGATIRLKNGVKAASTDALGRFEIPAQLGEVWVVSYLGYSNQEFEVRNFSPLSIELGQQSNNVEDVVVVGYGSQSKKEVTGAIASISGAALQGIAVPSFENAIAGRLPGVVVQEPSGEPGAGPTIRVRGLGSISAGSDPLYVIDGYPISKNVSSGVQGDVNTRTVAFALPSVNPLAVINSADIESIDVLKDAFASAIYGSRASNGVVIVTTKKGARQQQGKLNLDIFGGIQDVARRVKMMNAQEYAAYSLEAKNNAYVQDFPTASKNDSNAERYKRSNLAQYFLPDDFINPTGTDTDWQKEIFRTSPIQSYNLSYSGGGERSRYYVAGGYFNQQGIIKKSGYERYNLRINLESDLGSRVKAGINLAPSYTKSEKAPAGAPYFAVPPGIIYSALVTSPTVSPYLPDGSINQTDNQSHIYTPDGRGTGMTEASNPLAITAYINDNLQQYRTTANGFVSVDLLEGLTYKLYAGADFNHFNRSFYRSKAFLFRQATVGEPYGQSNASFNLNYILENTLTYDRYFGQDHHLNALVGYTGQKDLIEYNNVRAEKYPDDLVETVSGGQVTGGTGIREEWSLASVVSRINYAYKGKILLGASFRSDRASRFGSDKKTGSFPSFSAGYRISQESFLQDSPWLNELKVRGSWGKTGNFLIPNYASIGLLDPQNYVFGDVVQNGLAPSTIGNKNLTWEKTEQWNIGVDLASFQNRLSFGFDYYNKKTSDLLLYVQVPSSIGYTTALQNIGEVENKGFEVSVNSRNLVGGFKWSTDLVFSKNKNTVLRLGPNNEPILTAGAAGVRHITQVGSSIGSYYGYVVDGIYQSDAEVAQSIPDKIAPAARAGDFKFKDINGDGKIDANDRTVIGNYQPDFVYGITNRFDYKGFDLSIQLQGSQGGKVLNLTRRHLGNGEGATNSYKDWTERWVSAEQPGNGKIPRADRLSDNHGQNNRPSDFQVEDASFLRLRNITFGYDLTGKVLKGKVQRARVYVSGTNLYTWTKYIGFNPEVSNQMQLAQVQGEDYGAYPLIRSFSFGINVGF